MATSIRDYLLAGVAKQAGVQVLEAELASARDGMYSCAIKGAIVASDKGAFMDACDKLMSDFRRNLRGIAEKFEMAQAKDTHGELRTDVDGNPVYTVPSSLSSAKSVIGKAFDRGIKFGTIDKPESFSAIRTANKVAKDEEQATALTGDDKRRAQARELLHGIDAALDSYSGKVLTALIKLITVLSKQAEQAKPIGEALQKEAS